MFTGGRRVGLADCMEVRHCFIESRNELWRPREAFTGVSSTGGRIKWAHDCGEGEDKPSDLTMWEDGSMQPPLTLYPYISVSEGNILTLSG